MHSEARLFENFIPQKNIFICVTIKHNAGHDDGFLLSTREEFFWTNNFLYHDGLLWLSSVPWRLHVVYLLIKFIKSISHPSMEFPWQGEFCGQKNEKVEVKYFLFAGGFDRTGFFCSRATDG